MKKSVNKLRMIKNAINASETTNTYIQKHFKYVLNVHIGNIYAEYAIKDYNEQLESLYLWL